jgi:hypothetical protein
VRQTNPRSLITVVVLVHFAILMAHSTAHDRLHIQLSPAQSAYAIAAMLVAPLIAGGLLWTKLSRIGAGLFTLSMAGSLIFAGYNHFLSGTNDNTLQMQHTGWGWVFFISSILLFLIELAGCAVGLQAVFRPPSPQSK